MTLEPNRIHNLRVKLAERVTNQYNEDHDIGPDAPVPFMTYQLADVVDDILALLQEEAEKLENGPQILPEVLPNTQSPSEIAHFILKDMTPELKEELLEQLFMTEIGVPLQVAAEVIEKYFNAHGLVAFHDPLSTEPYQLLRAGIQFYLHGE